MEDPAATHDETAETGGPEPDPFAEIPADPLTGPPTEGPIDVQEGDLGKYRVEEETTTGGEPPAGEPVPEEEPAAEEPEFLEEPEETEPPVEEPAAEEPGEPEPEPPAEEPAPEPEPTPEPSAPEPEPEPAPAPEPPEPVEGDPPTPVEGSGGPPTGDPLGSEKTEGEPEPPPAEPEAGAEEPPTEQQPEKPKKKRRRKKKEVPGRRGYVILRLDLVPMNTEPGTEGYHSPVWIEAFPREIPIGQDGSEPVVVEARSGELALRNAYRQLTDNGEASFTLVAVPQKLFKPKSVEGKVPDSALAIKVG